MEAEVQACMVGCRLANEWVNMPVIFEGDYSALAEGMSSTGWDRSSFGSALKEAKGLALNLPDRRFKHVNRDGNRIAHELAQLAKRGVEAAVLRLESLPCIAELLAWDCKDIIIQ